MFWHNSDQKTRIYPLKCLIILILLACNQLGVMRSLHIGIPSMIEGAAVDAKLEIEIELLIIIITCMSWPRRCLVSKCRRIRLDCAIYELFQAVVWKTHTYCNNLWGIMHHSVLICQLQSIFGRSVYCRCTDVESVPSPPGWRHLCQSHIWLHPTVAPINPSTHSDEGGIRLR